MISKEEIQNEQENRFNKIINKHDRQIRELVYLIGNKNLEIPENGLITHLQTEEYAGLVFSQDEERIAEITNSFTLKTKDTSIKNKMPGITIKEDDKICDSIFDNKENLYYLTGKNVLKKIQKADNNNNSFSKNSNIGATTNKYILKNIEVNKTKDCNNLICSKMLRTFCNGKFLAWKSERNCIYIYDCKTHNNENSSDSNSSSEKANTDNKKKIVSKIDEKFHPLIELKNLLGEECGKDKPYISDFQFFNYRNYLVYGGNTFRIYIMNYLTQQKIYVYDIELPIVSLALSYDENLLAVGQNKDINVYQLGYVEKLGDMAIETKYNGDFDQEIGCSEALIKFVRNACKEAQKKVEKVTNDRQQFMNQHNLYMAKFELIKKLSGYHEGAVNVVKFSPKQWDSAIYSGGDDGKFKVIERPSYKVVENLTCDMEGEIFFLIKKR